MILSTSHNFLFVHDIKTAGTSLRSVLKGYSRPSERSTLYRFARILKPLGFRYPFYDFASRSHTCLACAHSIIPPPIYAKLFRFGVVRNPEAWTISVYKHWERYHQSNPRRSIPRSVNSLETFLEYLSDTGTPLIQALQFVDIHGRFDLTAVGSFENLPAFARFLKGQLSIPLPLPELNSSPKNQSIEVSRKAKKLIEECTVIDHQLFDFSTENTEGTRAVRTDPKLEGILAKHLRARGGVRYDAWAFAIRSPWNDHLFHE